MLSIFIIAFNHQIKPFIVWLIWYLHTRSICMQTINVESQFRNKRYIYMYQWIVIGRNIKVYRKCEPCTGHTYQWRGTNSCMGCINRFVGFCICTYFINRPLLNCIIWTAMHHPLGIQTTFIGISTLFTFYIFVLSNKWYLYWYFIKLWSLKNNSKQSFYLWYIFFTMSIVKWNLTLIHTFQQFNFIPFLMLTTVLLQICLIEFESQLLSWKPVSKLIILFYIACTRVVPKLGRQVARHRKIKLVPQWVQVIGILICQNQKIKINIKKWKL